MSLVLKSEEQHIVMGVAPGYWVSNDGRVWSTRPLNGQGPLLPWEQRREMKPIVQHNQYRTVVIDRKTVAVHALVLTAFVGPRPAGKQCRHLDGDKSNNRRDNLIWGTCVEQSEDRAKHGTKLVGSKIGTAKLTEAQVKEARSMRPTFPLDYIAKKFGVTKTCIWHAVSGSGSNWRHV
jgi:hypothetical protein